MLSMQRVAHNELGFGRNISRYSNRAEFSHLILGHLDRARIPFGSGCPRAVLMAEAQPIDFYGSPGLESNVPVNG